MATEFKIISIKTVTGISHLYIIAEFYVNTVLIHTEDFIIGRPAENRVYIGSVDEDGEILEPEAYETSPIDIKSEIVGVLKAFHTRHNEGLLTGSFTNRVDGDIETNDLDPLGFIARPEVQAMIGVKIDVSVAL